MRRVRLTIEYDGTDFAGFQLQSPGLRTVQGELEAALRKISGGTLRIAGAGRTDAGVHASGQVCHFDVDWKIAEEKVAGALNHFLARDVTVKEARYVGEDFHCRFSATSRTYRYAILNRPQPSALLGRYVWHVAKPLETARMQEAGRVLLGIHDFAAFGQANSPEKSTVRFLERVEVRRWRGCVLITVRGNAFLRQMVRSLVGTLSLAGQGKLTPSEVEAILVSGDRRQCPPIAPAQGLCLVRVGYDGKRLT